MTLSFDFIRDFHKEKEVTFSKHHFLVWTRNYFCTKTGLRHLYAVLLWSGTVYFVFLEPLSTGHDTGLLALHDTAMLANPGCLLWAVELFVIVKETISLPWTLHTDTFVKGKGLPLGCYPTHHGAYREQRSGIDCLRDTSVSSVRKEFTYTGANWACQLDIIWEQTALSLWRGWDFNL